MNVKNIISLNVWRKALVYIYLIWEFRPFRGAPPRYKTSIPKIGYFVYNAVFQVFYGYTTMSGVCENPMIDTEIMNLLQFFPKFYQFIVDLRQMTIILENGDFLSYATK